MKQYTAGLALAFVVVAMGCGGSQKPKTPAGPTCADVAAQTEKQMVETGAKEGIDMAAFGAIAREIIGERCVADAWSRDAIACLATASPAEMEGCAAKLTPAQNKAMEDAMKARLDSMSDEEKARLLYSDEAKPMEPASAAPPPPDDPCGGDE